MCIRDRVGGLATDYCVRATALDSQGAGFETEVVEAAVRAVDFAAGDGDRALAEMRRAGVRVCLLYTSRSPARSPKSIRAM